MDRYDILWIVTAVILVVAVILYPDTPRLGDLGGCDRSVW